MPFRGHHPPDQADPTWPPRDRTIHHFKELTVNKQSEKNQCTHTPVVFTGNMFVVPVKSC